MCASAGANSSPQPFVNGIKAARERIVARTDEDRSDFLRARGFSKAETGKIIETVLAEEGRPPESIFDFVQGITALARDKAHQDARLYMEGKAKKLLDWEPQVDLEEGIQRTMDWMKNELGEGGV